MSDARAAALAALYPSARQPVAAVAPPQPPAAAASATPSAPADLSATPAAASQPADGRQSPAAPPVAGQPAAPQPVASPPAAAPIVAPPPSAAAPAAPPVRQAVDARVLYNDIPETSQHVRWDEPPAEPGDIRFSVPSADYVDATSAGDAARSRLAEAMSAAGAGQTLAAELYQHAARAASPAYVRADPTEAAAKLQAAWGAGYEAKLAAVRGAVQTAAAKDPSLVGFLDRTGLGNDPTFIRKVAARIARSPIALGTSRRVVS